MSKLKAMAAVSVLVLLAGCGGTQSGGPGTYEVTVNNVSLSIQVPLSGANDEVAAINDLRGALGLQGPVTFVMQTGTNESDIATFMCDPRVVTDDGSTVKFQKAFIYVGEISNQISIDNVVLYNQGVDVYNSLLDQGELLPGASSTSLYIADQEVASIKSVFSGVAESVLQLEGCDTRLGRTSGSPETTAAALESQSATPPPELSAPLDASSALPTEDEIRMITSDTWRPSPVETTSATPPLDSELRKILQYGTVTDLEPVECSAFVLAASQGLPTDLTTGVTSISLADVLDEAYYDEGLQSASSVYFWGVSAYQLDGQTGDRVKDLLTRPIADCDQAEYTAPSGLNVPLGELRSSIDRSSQTPTAALIEGTFEQPDLSIVELIGDVLFHSEIDMGDMVKVQVLDLYNTKMDALAAQAGQQREPVRLATTD